MFLMVLGVADVVAGLLLVLSGSLSYNESAFVSAFVAIMVLKGLWSLIAALGGGFKYDLLGFLDVLSAIALYLAIGGMQSELFLYLGVLMLIKGLWSFVMGYAAE